MNQDLEKQIADYLRGVVSQLKIVRFSTSAWLAITSAFFIYVVSQGFFGNYLSGISALILANIVTIIVLMMIDGSLSKTLPTSLRMIFEGKFRQLSIKSKMVVVIFSMGVLLQMGVTGTISLLSNAEISTTAIGEQDNSDIASSIQTASNTYEKTSERLQNEYERLRETERERIKQAQKDAKTLLNTAIASKGEKMKGLYLSGNAWAESKLRSAIAKAKEQGAPLIEAEKNKTEQARIAYNDFLKTSGAQTTANIAALTETGKARANVWENRIGNMTNYLVVADWIALLFLLLSTAGLVIAGVDLTSEEHDAAVLFHGVKNKVGVLFYNAVKTVTFIKDDDLQTKFVTATSGTNNSANVQNQNDSNLSVPTGTPPNTLSVPIPTTNRTANAQNGRVRRAKTGTSAGTDKRFCMNCGTDISHRRSDAKFCGNTCRKEHWDKTNA